MRLAPLSRYGLIAGLASCHILEGLAFSPASCLPRLSRGIVPRPTSLIRMMSGGVEVNEAMVVSKLPGMKSVLFCEAGFGADQHGQDVTKAAMRACRNAIEFNSIPSIRRLVPGGYENMALRVTLAIPPEYRAGLDLDKVRGVFPYGQKVAVVDDGGGVFTSGIALKAMGDVNDDMLVVIAHVAVGVSDGTAPKLLEGEKQQGRGEASSKGGDIMKEEFQVTELEGMTQALFIAAGFGSCHQGEDATSASLDAIKNAMAFNAIPCITSSIPGGVDNSILRITIAVPPPYLSQVDVSKFDSLFPTGPKPSFTVVQGGGLFSNGVTECGKANKMLIAVAHVVVGAKELVELQ